MKSVWIFIGRTDAEAETPILWPPDAKNWLIWKDPDAGKDWGQKKGMTEDEMVGWHHWFNEHKFKQTQGDSERQRSLVCCSSWGRRVGHDLATEQQCTQYTEHWNLSSLSWWGTRILCCYLMSNTLLLNIIWPVPLLLLNYGLQS